MAMNGSPDQPDSRPDSVAAQPPGLPAAPPDPVSAGQGAQRQDVANRAADVEQADPNTNKNAPTPSKAEQAPQVKGRLAKKVDALNKFVDKTLVGLEPFTALLWLVLLRNAWDGVVELSHERLAKIMGVSDRTIARHLQVLKENRLLKVTRQGGFGRGVNQYRLGLTILSKNNPRKRIPQKKPQKSADSAAPPLQSPPRTTSP